MTRPRSHVPTLRSPIFSIKQAARYLHLNEQTVYRLATAGKIPAKKLGGSWRIIRDDLLAWMRTTDHNGQP